jgi:two-component system response regulator FlrC
VERGGVGPAALTSLLVFDCCRRLEMRLSRLGVRIVSIRLAQEVATFEPVEASERDDRTVVPTADLEENLSDQQVLICRDETTEQLLSMAENVAETPSTVLLTGESGVGKEVFARYIHRESPRSDAPWIGINCAALPPSLLESELFGHEKGAFSGAVQQHSGVFEQADGGTLLLDEVAEMPKDLQAKLLRVLQEESVTRVGGQESIDLDVRIVATTNRDLRTWVEEGKFRHDLYYRLNVFPLELPPLRDRPRDIEPIVRLYLAQFADELDQRVRGITPDALERLERYPYPGNVRELLNILERAVIMCEDGSVVGTDELVLDRNVDLLDTPRERDDGDDSHIVQFKAGDEPLTDVRRDIILNTLLRYDGNRTKTAEVLGVSVRTIRNKIKEYREAGIPVPD